MAVVITIKRGVLSALPTLANAEPVYLTDQPRLYIGNTSLGNTLLSCLKKINGTTAPTVNEDAGDGYSVGSVWTDTTNDKSYICSDSSVGAAVWQQISGDGSMGITQLTGDVTAGPGSGSQAATIANSAVTLAMMANIADQTILGNDTGGAAAPVALTASQVRTLLSLVVGTNVQAYDAELTQIAALADPNADRILFWDDSAGSYAFLAPGTGVEISGTTLRLADGDYGDITVSVLGSTWTIDNGAVTYAKIQDVSATDKLLGRSTAGAGVVEEIACTAFGRSLIDDAAASNARTTLGATTVGGNMFKLANPSAISFPRFNADNTVDALSASGFRTAIGAGTGSVTSVTQTVPAEMSIAGSPVTTIGTLAITWASASGSKVIASPAGGGSGAYAGRALVVTDLPRSVVILRDEKTSATDGGTFTSGAWRVRDLNTEASDAGGLCSLSGNQFTLTAGTYRIRATAPAYYVQAHQAKLYNATDATDVIIGTCEYSGNAAATGYQTRSVVSGEFTIAASKALEIRHQCGVTFATYGFGVANSFGTQVYTEVELERVA